MYKQQLLVVAAVLAFVGCTSPRANPPGGSTRVPGPTSELNDVDALIEKFGETMPDAWHPALPAVPGTMGPEPTALFAARQDYAAALERHGYTEKAARVRETYKLGPMPTATRR